MVKMMALKRFSGIYGSAKKGDVLDVSDTHAKSFEQRGLAVPVIGGKMLSAPQNKAKGAAPANKADADPTNSRRAGSRTGEASDASLSEPARQRKTSTSTKSADEPESSPSTTRGSSRRGRKSSTAATGDGGKNTRASRRSKG